MKRIFKIVRNFLAMWAGALVGIFLVSQLIEMLKAFVSNAKTAFQAVTDVKLVLATMAGALIVAVLTGIFRKKEKSPYTEEN